jgi:hypothetical protein
LTKFLRGILMANPLIDLYRKLPEDKRKLINDYLSVLKKMVRYGTELRFKVYEDLEEKKFVYITSDEPDTGFIEYFFPGATVTRTKTLYLWSLPKFVHRYDRVILDMHSRLARFFTGGVISFAWIRQRLNLTTMADELLGRKWILRERKKAEKFQAVFSTDPADLDFFYEKLYVPYIRKRFQDALFIKKVFFQKSLGNTSELCLLRKGDEIVAGCLFDHIGDRYILLTLGVTDETCVKEGATSALYYYGIKRALEKKAHYFDFGLSRPFIFDGVFNYKRRWGGAIERDTEINRVMYLKNITRDGLITLDNTTFRVLVSADNEALRALSADAGLEAKTVDKSCPLIICNPFSFFEVFCEISEIFGGVCLCSLV